MISFWKWKEKENVKNVFKSLEDIMFPLIYFYGETYLYQIFELFELLILKED